MQRDQGVRAGRPGDRRAPDGLRRGGRISGPLPAFGCGCFLSAPPRQGFGIDPYTVADALQDDTHHVGVAVNEWARAFDWEGLHSEVSETIDALGLGGRCELWRTTSQQAASRFPDSSIDMVHIDGNHDRAAVEDDIDLYLPKLRPGGFVILDDVTWESIRPAYLRMLDRAELVFQFFDGRSLGVRDGVGNDFAIFRLTGP
jgi:hypothetical protein